MNFGETGQNVAGKAGKPKMTWPSLTIFLAMIAGLLLGVFVGLEQARSAPERAPARAGFE